MSRTVFCKKYQQDLPGLEKPPYPGPKGQGIYETVSKQAWQDWLSHQTMLINEKHLNMMDPSSRQFLAEQMDKFFTGEDYEKAEGYVPPSPSDEPSETSKEPSDAADNENDQAT